MTGWLPPHLRALTAEQLAAHDAALAAKHLAFARARHREAIARRVATLGVPLDMDGHARLVDGQLVATPALDHLRSWIATRPRPPVLALLGAPGAGKTLAAAWWIAASDWSADCDRYEEHPLGAYGRWLDVVRLARARDAHPTVAAAERCARFDKLLASPRLVLDELRDLDTDEGQRVLLDVVDARQRAGTVLIANMPRKDFDARLVDGRLRSRLASARIVEVGAVDLRQRRAG